MILYVVRDVLPGMEVQTGSHDSIQIILNHTDRVDVFRLLILQPKQPNHWILLSLHYTRAMIHTTNISINQSNIYRDPQELSSEVPTTQAIHTTSLRPFWSLDRRGLLVSWARTTMVKSRSFTVVGPYLWNSLLPSSRNAILSSNFSTPVALLLFSRSYL